MTEHEKEEILLEIRRQVKGMHEELQFLRKHRNMLLGTPVLEFDEVCSLLRLSERTVRRLRESGQLVGFSFRRRRFYAQEEVDAFIARMRRGKVKHEEPLNLNPDGSEA